MEILRGRLFGVASSAKCAAPLERHFERRRLQNSSLLSLHRFVASAKASDRFGAAALGKNAFRVAAIRTCSRCIGAGAGRHQRKCRSELLAGAHLPGAGGCGVRATRAIFSQLLARSPTSRGRPRPSSGSRRCYQRVSDSAGVASWRGRTSRDRKSTRLNSSHRTISYAVFCLKKKKKKTK